MKFMPSLKTGHEFFLENRYVISGNIVFVEMTFIFKIKTYTTPFRKSKRSEKIFEKIKKSDGMPSDF